MGTHLFNYLNLDPGQFTMVPFEDDYYGDPAVLRKWVTQCDTIVHLATLNRHNDPNEIYQTNIRLVKELLSVLDDTGSTPHLLFASSTQEEFDNPYGRSKKEGRKLMGEWAEKKDAPFTGLVIPNVFGPFGNPYYNSVVATFSHQLTHDEQTRIDVDKSMELIYVGELTKVFRDCIVNRTLFSAFPTLLNIR